MINAAWNLHQSCFCNVKKLLENDTAVSTFLLQWKRINLSKSIPTSSIKSCLGHSLYFKKNPLTLDFSHAAVSAPLH